MKHKFFLLLPAAAFVLALAACTGPINYVEVTLPTARARTQFMAHVDGIAQHAGLHALPDRPEQHQPHQIDRDYSAAAGMESEGILILWHDNTNVVDVFYPDDGSLEWMASEIRKYAHAAYGRESVSTNRQVPILRGVLRAWDGQ